MAYANGTGGWCGCNCNCCPPQPLYSTVTVVFCVGTPASDWAGPLPDLGCDCGPVHEITKVGLRSKNLPALQAMPAFGQEDFLGSDDGLFVFALSAGGCIPAHTVTVTYSTTGLGFWVSGTTIYAVGGGTVTAVADTASIVGCGTLTPLVNGSPSTATVSDGDTITPGLLNSDSTYGCTVCEEGFTPVSMMKALQLGEIQQLQRRLRRKATLDKKMALRERIKKTSHPSKPASQPPQTSP